MSHHGNKHPRDRVDPAASRHVQGSSPGSQLEPDNYLLECQGSGGSDSWVVVAVIVVDPSVEQWTVDIRGALLLQTATAIRLTSTLATIPRGATALAETADTVVKEWTKATDPRYPTGGRTFAGDYVCGGTTTKLAINFETVAVTGGAAIVADTWFNPDLTGGAVNLKASRGTVTLSLVTTGTYVGTCLMAAVTKRYTAP